MRINNFFSAFVIFFVVLLFAACGTGSDQKGLAEGVIEFDAVAVDQKNPMANMAPSKMTVKFKDNKFIAQMSAGMGVVSLSIISDPAAKRLIEMVKVFTSKAAHMSDSNDVRNELISMPKLHIEETGETKVIAGYNCKKAMVTYIDFKDRPGFDVYYTDELSIENSNWANQYNTIKGVLMEYQVDRYGMEMRFTAKKVEKSEIENTAFDLPKEYKLISKNEMDDIFKSLQ